MMTSEIEEDVLTVLISEADLKQRVQELGEALYVRFARKRPLFVGVLKGAFLFLADLIRACPLQSDVDFVSVSSYGASTVSGGQIRIRYDLQQDIAGRHLILVEDILDTGNTLAFLRARLLDRGAASVTIVTLLDKPARRVKAVQADFSGFTVPNAFLVGYGLDYAERYRNLPYIGILKPAVYQT